ncbi:hypothetical protein [Sulfurimonas sp.]|jgi:hypothetical protein|uniref:hypothetical protein n=1 Tax=Sulfurimonas sp. TaxID=2022749 RepID=UPI0025DEFB71|nr:hypothetical protein [Sulfurimonas sp.]
MSLRVTFKEVFRTLYQTDRILNSKDEVLAPLIEELTASALEARFFCSITP